MYRIIGIPSLLLFITYLKYSMVQGSNIYDLSYRGTGCEGSSVSYICPDGYTMNIQSVTYGRRDNETCVSDVPINQTVFEDCDIEGADDIVESLCNGKNSCLFTIDNNTFGGSSCDNVYKYIDTLFTCEVMVHTTEGCEGDTIEITCPSGQSVHLTDLTYGRIDENVTCQHEAIFNTSCFASEPGLTAVSSLCNGRTNCTFMVFNEILGDPCPGTYKSISLDYICGDCVNKHNESACETFADWGECNNRPNWMTANCRKTCWDCLHLDECSNRFEESELCDYWAQIGECVRPSASTWMNTNCRHSCNTCNNLFKAEPVKEAETEFLCENNRLDLKCEGNLSLRIDDLHFARWSNEWCMHESVNETTPTCDSPDGILDIAKKVCDGRQECFFEPRTDVFGDSCPGTYKQSQITYTCQDCSNAYNDEECEYKKGLGECETKTNWMLDYCFETCTGCKTKECGNVFDASATIPSCDYWAMKGECERNTDYMYIECQTSCNWCVEEPVPTTTTIGTTIEPKGTLPAVYEEVCEGKVAEMNCPVGFYVRLDAIFFGRLDNISCPHENINTTNCTTPEGALVKARAACDGRNPCTFVAQSDVWGDPCPGTYKAASVLYTCSACENIEGDDNCTQWASEGKCISEYASMMENCYKTCSQCEHKGCGNNHVSSVNCDYWALRGECLINHPFMLSNCKESCQSCIDSPEYLPPITKETCEADYLELVCPDNYYLQINDMFYGRIDNETCQHESVSSFNCTTDQAAIWKLRNLCEGRDDCFFEARSELWGNNCPDTFKHADVNYTCQLCRNRMTDLECLQLADQGMCTLDYDNMMTQCYLTCSGCINRGCGNSHYSSLDCDYWTTLGECGNNPSFMGDVCKESCKMCEAITTTPVPTTVTTEPHPDKLPTESETICEIQVRHLECPDDYHLRVESIFYGRRDTVTCPHENATNIECPTVPGAVDLSREVCDGRQTCWFEARSNIWGDNCPNTFKFATAVYTCQLCRNMEPDSDCLIWKAAGRCEDEYDVMMDQCFQTCSECNEVCINSHKNDLDCDYWAHLGECDINPDWMSINCEASCKTCPVVVTTTTTPSPYQCDGVNNCNSNGDCVETDTCQCHSGWEGDMCDTFTCKDVNFCSSQGQCFGPNQCHCFGHVSGSDCNACNIVYQPGPACLPCSMCDHGICVANPQDTSVETFMGCFRDVANAPDFSHRVVDFQPLSSLECMSQCHILGFKFAAMQNGSSCSCDNTYGSYGEYDRNTASACNASCHTDGDMCGGVNANSVWQVYQGMCDCEEGWDGPMCAECTGESCPTSTTTTVTVSSGESTTTTMTTKMTTTLPSSTTPVTSLTVNFITILQMPWKDIYSNVANVETISLYQNLTLKLLAFYQRIDTNVATVRIIKLRQGSVVVENEVSMSSPQTLAQQEKFQCAVYKQMQTSENPDLPLQSDTTLDRLCSWRTDYCKNDGNLVWNEDQWQCSCPDKYSGANCEKADLDRTILIVIIVAACAVFLIVFIVILCVCARKGSKRSNSEDDHEEAHSMHVTDTDSFAKLKDQAELDYSTGAGVGNDGFNQYL